MVTRRQTAYFSISPAAASLQDLICKVLRAGSFRWCVQRWEPVAGVVQVGPPDPASGRTTNESHDVAKFSHKHPSNLIITSSQQVCRYADSSPDQSTAGSACYFSVPSNLPALGQCRLLEACARSLGAPCPPDELRAPPPHLHSH